MQNYLTSDMDAAIEVVEDRAIMALQGPSGNLSPAGIQPLCHYADIDLYFSSNKIFVPPYQ